MVVAQRTQGRLHINIDLVLTEKQKVDALEIYKRKVGELKRCRYGELDRTILLMEDIEGLRTLFDRNNVAY